MPIVVNIIAPGFVEDSEKIDLAIHLNQNYFSIFNVCKFILFFAAILNSHNRFAAASAAPIILNLVLIGIFYLANI